MATEDTPSQSRGREKNQRTLTKTNDLSAPKKNHGAEEEEEEDEEEGEGKSRWSASPYVCYCLFLLMLANLILQVNNEPEKSLILKIPLRERVFGLFFNGFIFFRSLEL